MPCYTNQPDWETLLKWHDCGEVSNGLLHVCDVLAQMSTHARELAEDESCLLDFDQLMIELEARLPTQNVVRILGEMCVNEEMKNTSARHEAVTHLQEDLF